MPFMPPNQQRQSSEGCFSPWNYLEITNETLHSIATSESLAKSSNLSSFCIWLPETNKPPSPQPLKKLNFENPMGRMAANLKDVKTLYLRSHSTDFDEIWHGDTHWLITAD